MNFRWEFDRFFDRSNQLQFTKILFFEALKDVGLIDTTHGSVIKSLINIHGTEGWEHNLVENIGKYRG